MRAVAFAFPRGDKASLDEISLIDNWEPGVGFHLKIPSIISYSPAQSPSDQQWGASISQDSFPMERTKLELDPNSRAEILKIISGLLEGRNNLEWKPRIPMEGSRRNSYGLLTARL